MNEEIQEVKNYKVRKSRKLSCDGELSGSFLIPFLLLKEN
jgi:hypothetical protein